MIHLTEKTDHVLLYDCFYNSTMPGMKAVQSTLLVNSIYTCTHTYTLTHKHILAHSKCTIQFKVHTHTHTHIHTHTCVHTHTHIHTYKSIISYSHTIEGGETWPLFFQFSLTEKGKGQFYAYLSFCFTPPPSPTYSQLPDINVLIQCV